MTKKQLLEKLNKEYPKLLKTISNKKISQAEKKKKAMEFTKFLEELADNTPVSYTHLTLPTICSV